MIAGEPIVQTLSGLTYDVERRCELRLQLLAFAASCLDTVVPDNDTLRRIVNLSTQLACQLPAAKRFEESDEALRNADAGLSTLLDVQTPENASRIARAVVTELTLSSNGEATSTSVGLVYGLLRIGGQDPSAAIVLRLIEDGLRTAGPSKAAEAWRRSFFEPTLDGVKQVGIDILYSWCIVCGQRYPAPAYLLLKAVLTAADSRDRQLCSRVLEDLYPVIKDYRMSRSITLGPVWEKLAERADLGQTMALSRLARGATILLYMPVALKFGLEPLHVGYASSIRRMSRAERVDMRNLVDSLNLPEAARDRMIAWVEGRESFFASPRRS